MIDVYTVDSAEPCSSCGRTRHRIVLLESGPACAEAEPLEGWEPAPGLARVTIDDGSGVTGWRLTRARKIEGAFERECLGSWVYEDANGHYVDGSWLSPAALRYLPELAAIAVDVERVSGRDAEMLGVSASTLACSLRGAVWTSSRAKADGAAIASCAERIARGLVPALYGEAAS